MIQERYCSFEVSKLLKEKGFDEPCRSYFINDLGDYRRCTVEITNRDCSSEQILRPTHQMAMDWLREHGFHINAIISYDNSVDADGNEVDRWTFYTFEICSSISGNLIYTEEVNEYDSYEEAVEASLKYCLTELI